MIQGEPNPQFINEPLCQIVAFTGERNLRNDWHDEAMFANTYISRETNYAKVDKAYGNIEELRNVNDTEFDSPQDAKL